MALLLCTNDVCPEKITFSRKKTKQPMRWNGLKFGKLSITLKFNLNKTE